MSRLSWLSWHDIFNWIFISFFSLGFALIQFVLVIISLVPLLLNFVSCSLNLSICLLEISLTLLDFPSHVFVHLLALAIILLLWSFRLVLLRLLSEESKFTPHRPDF